MSSRRVLAVSGLALALGVSAVFAQDVKPAEKTPTEKLREEMAAEAKRFLESVKVTARDATMKAEQAQQGIVISIHPEKHMRTPPPEKKDPKAKDRPKEPKKKTDGGTKDANETKMDLVDCFEVFIVKEQEEPKKEEELDENGKPKPKPPMPPGKGPTYIAWSVSIDTESKPIVKQLKDEEEREVVNAARRIAAAQAKVSVRGAIEKVQAFAKGSSVLAVLLEDRMDKHPPAKGELPHEDWLVYARVGEVSSYYLVDLATGEVRKKS
ncbi:hypothetical protein HY251_00290 [bacterium]|nr:hypothetical protein [bacterium]